MSGDLITLTAVAGFVAVMSGAFLVLMGWRYQATSIAASVSSIAPRAQNEVES